MIHSDNNYFFNENDKTGNEDLDNLILDCVNSNQEIRPTS